MAQLVVLVLFAILFDWYQRKLFWLGCSEILLAWYHWPIMMYILFSPSVFLFHLRPVNFLKIVLFQFLFTGKRQFFELVFSKGPLNHPPNKIYRWRSVNKVTAVDSCPKITGQKGDCIHQSPTQRKHTRVSQINYTDPVLYLPFYQTILNHKRKKIPQRLQK